MGKIYINENQVLVKKMIEIYKPDQFDWMSYQITVSNVLTFHHIVEQSKGGLTIIENGALITKKGHRALNMLESRDISLYIAWNQLFQEINKSFQPPDTYYIEESKVLKKHTQKVLHR